MIPWKYAYLFNESSSKKELFIEVSEKDSDGQWNRLYTLNNEHLYSEQFELTEQICSDNDIKYGTCESNYVKFRVRKDVDQYIGGRFKDKKIDIYMRLSNDSVISDLFKIGVFYCKSDKITADMNFRDVIAYDRMYDYINLDMTKWYQDTISKMKQYPSQLTLEKLVEEFFDYTGDIYYEPHNNYMSLKYVSDTKSISNLSESSKITAQDILQSICELYGAFGNFDRGGIFRFLQIDPMMNYFLPENTLYPSDDLYPEIVIAHPWQKQKFAGTMSLMDCEYDGYNLMVEIWHRDAKIVWQNYDVISKDGTVIRSGTDFWSSIGKIYVLLNKVRLQDYPYVAIYISDEFIKDSDGNSLYLAKLAMNNCEYYDITMGFIDANEGVMYVSNKCYISTAVFDDCYGIAIFTDKESCDRYLRTGDCSGADNVGGTWPIQGSYVESCTYDDFKVPTVTNIALKSTKDSTYTLYGSEGETYVRQYDLFSLNTNPPDSFSPTNTAIDILSYIKLTSEYDVTESSVKGNPCIEIGDSVHIMGRYGDAVTYVLKRTLKGIQKLTDEISVTGEEHHASIDGADIVPVPLPW